MTDKRKRQHEIWRETRPEPCPRCVEWNAAGLSSRCPSCDMVHFQAYEEKIKAEGLEL